MPRFDQQAFNTLLSAQPGSDGLGQRVSWRRGWPCPCRNPKTLAARRDCARCQGNGWFWSQPEPGTPWTGLAGMKVAREWATFSEWQSGDVILSIPEASPLWMVGEMDRIVFTDSSQPFKELLQRGRSDRIRGTIESIERVFYVDALTQDIEECPIPPWNALGELDWAGISGAPPGEYSITGRRRPEYFIYKEMPQERAHHAGMPLPRRVVARKWDLFGRDSKI